MPRGQKMMKAPAQNALQKQVLDKVLGSFCEIKNIEAARHDTIVKLFAETDRKVFEPGQTLPLMLDDIYADIHSTFRVDHSYSTQITLIPPPAHVIKDFIYKLPKVPSNLIYRIILLAGTHEVFNSPILSRFTGNRGIFVRQGHAIKMSVGHGDFTYDNKGRYNTDFYPGKGIKNPERRHLIIFDFCSDQEEEKSKTLAVEAERVTGQLSQSGEIVSEIVDKLELDTQE